MKKIVGSVVALVLLGVFAFQAQSALAGKTGSDKPLTSPITPTPPVSSPCKPGFGYGDKNHCHITPTPPPVHHDDKHDNDKHDDHHDDHGHR